MGSTSAVRMMNSQIPRLRVLVASLALFVSRAETNRGAVKRGEGGLLEPRSGESIWIMGWIFSSNFRTSISIDPPHLLSRDPFPVKPIIPQAPRPNDVEE